MEQDGGVRMEEMRPGAVGVREEQLDAVVSTGSGGLLGEAENSHHSQVARGHHLEGLPGGGEHHQDEGVEEKRLRLDEKKRKRDEQGKKILKRKRSNAKTSPVARVGSPIVVTRSPVINRIVKAAALKRSLMMEQSPQVKRAKKSPIISTSQKTPGCTIAYSIPDPPNEGSSLQDLSPRSTSHAARKPRKLKSQVWKDDEPIYDDSGMLVNGRCKHCDQIFPTSKQTGSSQLGRHLKVCELKAKNEVMLDRIRSTCYGEVDPMWKFDQKVARRALVLMIVQHELPFSFVEYRGFRLFIRTINPWFKVMSRTTVQCDCMNAYIENKVVVQDFFKNLHTRVSLTADMWTSKQKLGYLCITAHWISEDWEMDKRIIRFCLVETPHDGTNIFNLTLKSLHEWNVEDKIFGFTVDNASVNDKMIDLLRKNLKERRLLHHKGKILHNRCAAHVLNLVVQDGLKAMKKVLDDIRDSVRFVGSSQYRIEKFDEMLAHVGLAGSRHPPIDVTHRWNSSFLMLEATMHLRAAFEALKGQEPAYKTLPSPEEWTMAQAICNLLKGFYTATNAISASDYPTSHLYFYEFFVVKQILEREGKSGNPTIKLMVKEMEAKWLKYFEESYRSSCIPVIFDPRFKLELC